MINLLSDHLRVNNRYAYRNVHILRYTVVSMLTMAAIVAITGINILNMQRTEDNLKTQIDEQSQKLGSYKSLETRGKQLSDQLSTISSLLERQVNFSDLLPGIAKTMPSGAILKQLNFSTSDILPAPALPAAPGAAGATPPKNVTDKPFVILAGIKDRKIATTLLENIRASKDLFTDADLVDVTQNISAEGAESDTNSDYPYQVTINAYLKKLNTDTKKAGNKQ